MLDRRDLIAPATVAGLAGNFFARRVVLTVTSFFVNRFASYLLIGCFVFLGTGLAEALHELEHDAEDARVDAADHAAGRPVVPHHHDETNCPVHAQLHMPGVPSDPPTQLLPSRTIVGVLPIRAESVHSGLSPTRIDCRGPPACF